MFHLLFLLLLAIAVNALDFKVVSYNVENLFDLKVDGTEYKDYQPNTKYWNKKSLKIKIKNISKVINQIDANIVALQEIETKEALKLLLKKLPQYKYSSFVKNSKASVGLAILSKFKIIKTNKIQIDKFDKYARPIQEVIFKIDNKEFILFNNHWRSKKAGENERVKYSMALKEYLDGLYCKKEYILIGDFNSNYNEWISFRNEKRLNNTYGITGINHILNTILDNKLILKSTILKKQKLVHYNLWLELLKKERFSTIFRNQKNTPDNILLPKTMFDKKNISYIDNSFKVFRPIYLYKNKIINKWKRYKGYSDHLPIMASFTTNKNYKRKYTKVYKLKTNKISFLYDCEYLEKPFNLKDVIVIYKNKKSAILKQKNNRAIYAYNCAKYLELGKSYNLTINKIDNYNGLIEVKSISKVKQNKQNINYKALYKDGSKIDIFDTKYTNEVVTNLTGIYKKNYLYLTNGKKIKLYSPKKSLKTKNNSKLTINCGHLTIYKGQVQITLH